ncbi:MAG: MFS transporter [Sphingomonadaceae bacterium]
MLGLLLLVYTFNFIDRQIIGILAAPIKADLGLSDTELGLMGGLAFALFYTALGIPVAIAADRWSRSTIIAIALALWSFFTALCGFANNFWQLFFARLGVGVGEAGGVAPSYALIADYFPPEQRARALAVFSFGIPLGSALGVMLGGWVATAVDWRFAFVAVGVAGFLIVPIFRLGVPEPPRGLYDPPVAPGPRASVGEVLRTVTGKPTFWLISFGASCSSMCGYGLMFWLPSYFNRSLGLDLVQISLFMGAILFVGGIAGVWAGGWLGDRLGKGDKRAYVGVPAVAFIVAVPFYAAGILTESLPVAFLLFLLPQALALMWLGPVLAAIQGLVPPTMRATASAAFLFINNLLGIGAGTLFFGVVSDLYGDRFGIDSLRYAIITGLGFYVLAAGFLALAARRIEQDWHYPASQGGVAP